MYGKRKHSSKGGQRSFKRLKGAGGRPYRANSRSAGSGGRVQRFRPSLSLWNLPGQVPDQLNVKCRTWASFETTSTSGAIVQCLLYANSLFTPFRNVASSGASSAAAENLRASYSYYRVMGCAIDIRAYSVANTETAPHVPFWFGLEPVPNQPWAVANTESKLMANPRARRLICTNSSYAMERAQRLAMYHSTAEIVGQPTTQVYGDNDMKGSCSQSGDFGDPATLWCYNLLISTADGASTGKIGWEVLFTQYIHFEGRAAGA